MYTMALVLEPKHAPLLAEPWMDGRTESEKDWRDARVNK